MQFVFLAGLAVLLSVRIAAAQEKKAEPKKARKGFVAVEVKFKPTQLEYYLKVGAKVNVHLTEKPGDPTTLKIIAEDVEVLGIDIAYENIKGTLKIPETGSITVSIPEKAASDFKKALAIKGGVVTFLIKKLPGLGLPEKK